MTIKLKPCPFCGSVHIDPEGWLRNDGISGPACDNCGASAGSITLWNKRVNQKYIAHNYVLCSTIGQKEYCIRREDRYAPRYWAGPKSGNFTKPVFVDEGSKDVWFTDIKNEAERYLEELIWFHILEHSK